MESFAAAYFTTPLVDVGSVQPEFSGVLCPLPELNAEKVGITDQFLDNAEVYHSKYSNSPHWTALLGKAISLCQTPPKSDCLILDIGTGSGINTVFPLLSYFPECRIVATDLSPQLLAMLYRKINGDGLNERVACINVDAMANHFRPGVFDVVVGGAILHHLMDPKRALAAAYDALRPGGYAMFFEPYEGANILRIAYDLIIERAARENLEINPEAKSVLSAMSLDYSTRTGTDKSAIHFRYMDDKWLFTRKWLVETAKECGFDEPRIHPINAPKAMFSNYTEVNLRLAAGLSPSSLPAWAWSILEHFDNGFSDEMKSELAAEVILVLHKPSN